MQTKKHTDEKNNQNIKYTVIVYHIQRNAKYLNKKHDVIWKVIICEKYLRIEKFYAISNNPKQLRARNIKSTAMRGNGTPISQQTIMRNINNLA